jgi:hypothetical protein
MAPAAGPASGAEASSQPAGTQQAAAPSSTSPQTALQLWFANLLEALKALVAAIQRFPIWVQSQQLQRLREAYEEDPKDADKHAAYLKDLGKAKPKEVSWGGD